MPSVESWGFKPCLKKFRAKFEKRADSSYTDALVSALTSNAGGRALAIPTATAALEACAGFVGRAFAGAAVESASGINKILNPPLLSMIGRALIRRGEVVFYIDASVEGGVYLLPCESWDVNGGPNPNSWRYRCTVGGPERTHTYDRVPAEGVVHLSYARDPERPWRGYGPLYVASLAGRLSAETANALADEAAGPRGSFLPVPTAQVNAIGGMTADIRKARGDMLLAEGGDWDNVASGASARYEAKRFGAAPPPGLVELHKLASMEVYAACGVSPLIFAAGQGTAAREGYRQTLFGTISPLGKLVETELRNKLDDATISLTWDELRAADISGRARAFQSMVGGGMEVDRAAALSGLLSPAEADD